VARQLSTCTLAIAATSAMVASRICMSCSAALSRVHRLPGRDLVGSALVASIATGPRLDLRWHGIGNAVHTVHVSVAGILSEALHNIKRLSRTPYAVDQGAISK
jgi:hypothetical protein